MRIARALHALAKGGRVGAVFPRLCCAVAVAVVAAITHTFAAPATVRLAHVAF